ncbi:MAG: metal-dependent hydrolase [Acidobacteriaceae bacterium]|nr:metal-dependent hydrolase [Acidobacteriaceae bacterium]
MDNVTHSLTGLALARAGLHSVSPRATLLLILSANVPDIDLLGLSQGQLRYLEVHRGYTHSLVCLPAMAALCVLVVAAIYRQKLPWLRAWLLCSIGVASHLLLDLTTTYGTRLLLPFSSRWFYLDLNGLYDVWILAALLFAALWPLFARLVSREIGARAPTGRASAVAALCFFLLFDAARAVLHARAMAQLESRLYDDAPPLQAAALPDAYSPLRWSGVVESAPAYRLLDVDVAGNLDLEAARVFYKPEITRGLLNVEATPPFRYFRYFARFPAWSVEPVTLESGTGQRFDVTDLRFGILRAGGFHCIALVNENGSVLQSAFTYGSGAELGWGAERAVHDR